MKLWLDDVRPAPQGWVHAWTYEEAVQWIEERGDEITEVSLDHDLCQAHYTGDYSDCETGFDVLALLLERGLRPVIHLHTMNAEGVQRMQDLLDSL